MNGNGIKIVAFSALLAVALSSAAAPLDAEAAAETAGRWMASGRQSGAARRAAASGARRRMRPSGSVGGLVRTCSLGGTNLFHLVAVDGGGFVAVSADDLAPPIMGFSPSGELPDPDPANPFWALVGGDAAARARGGARLGASASGFEMKDTEVAMRNPAARLASASPVQDAGRLEDVRVWPLVESTWDQSEVGSKSVYNAYTPNGSVCGCVATAMAQLMRYHRYPAAPVAAQTFTCATNGVAVDLTMIGGAYDWDSMPLRPTSSISEAERLEIGKICYDAGVAVRMQYTPKSSAAFSCFAHDPLVNVFGFASAKTYMLNGGIEDEIVENGILANLDAECPVMLGIYSASAYEAGHAVLADGYGFSDGTLYCHLNMGWSGSYDYWYALPEIKAGGYAFVEVGDLIYNVFPDAGGELVTGRVLDETGNGVEGATVSAAIEYRIEGMLTTVTNVTTTAEGGIYAIRTPSGAYSWKVSLSAAKGRSESALAGISVSRSRSTTSVDFDTGGYSLDGRSFYVGNRWGNDIVLPQADLAQPEFTAFAPAADGAGYEAAFTGTPGATYAVERSGTLAPPSWSACTNVVVPASGEARLVLEAPEGAESLFFRITAE